MIVTNTDLVLFADKQLPPEKRQLLYDLAKHDEKLKATLAMLEASNLPFKPAFEWQNTCELPDRLRQTVKRMVSASNHSNYHKLPNTKTGIPPDVLCAKLSGELKHDNTRISLRFSQWAQAACLALGIVTSAFFGYSLGNQSALKNKSIRDTPDSVTKLQTVESKIQKEWVDTVANYQSLYVSNTVKGLIPDRKFAKALLSKVSDNNTINATIPNLTKEGYQFVRAQELGYEGDILVQLIYTKEGHTPLALCFMSATGSSNTPLKTTKYPNLLAADWVKQGQRFVIVASETASTLQKLHTIIATAFHNT